MTDYSEKLQKNEDIDDNHENTTFPNLFTSQPIEQTSQIYKKGMNDINEKTMIEILEILYENMKQENDNIDMISRKALLELSEKNLSLTIKYGIETIQTCISNNSKNSLDQISVYVTLLQEIIEKHGTLIDKTTFKFISTFGIESIQSYITGCSLKDSEKQRQNGEIIALTNKLLVYIGKT